MFFEIVLCFFTVFGILQALSILWDMIFCNECKNATLIVKINEETDLRMLCLTLKKRKDAVLFLYENIDEEDLEMLKCRFEFAMFIPKGDIKELVNYI